MAGSNLNEFATHWTQAVPSLRRLNPLPPLPFSMSALAISAYRPKGNAGKVVDRTHRTPRMVATNAGIGHSPSPKPESFAFAIRIAEF
jgi:hypothetical protein